MAATDITFAGLWYAAGETVSVVICGLDCGDFEVTADGTVTVPLQSDEGELLTAAYIISKDGVTPGADQNVAINIFNGVTHELVTVPVVIGFNYISQGQVLRPASAQDIGSRLGPALGKTRRAASAAMLLYNTIKIKVGTDFDGVMDTPEMTNPSIPTELPANEMFNGPLWVPALTDNYSFDSMLAWEVNRPWPCTVAACSSFISAEER